MTMVATIALKEIRENLLSVRFYLIFALTVALFIAGSTVFVVNYGEKTSDFRNDAAVNQEAFRAAGRTLGAIAQFSQTLIKTPNPYEFLSEGNEKDLPDRFQSTIYETDFPEAKGRGNFLLRDFSSLDWAFIVAVILSFLAFVLSHDAVTAEKERRTLSLVFANSVRTADVFLGKFLGLWATIGIPLVAGMAAGILIVGLSGGVPLEFSRMGLFLAASLLYLGFFLLVGLTVSSLTSQSLTSAVALLFVWVLIAFIIPTSGRLVAGLVSSAPAKAKILIDMEKAMDEIYDAKYKGTMAGRWNENVRDPWVPLRSQWVADRLEVRNRMFEDYIRKLIRQAAGTKALIRVSPISLFSGLTEEIAGTGIGRFEDFYAQVNRYREGLYRFVEDRDRQDPASVHLIPLGAWEQVAISGLPVGFDLVPKFQEKIPSPKDRFRQVIGPLGFLLVLSIVMFYLGYLIFVRYDKR
jgi:ABC-type transport system involved in multi-copper enzyme maturation permease subunit